MPRAPMQVLVLPFRRTPEGLNYCVLRRADDGRWQGVAGGGEQGERSDEAARREAYEEIGLPVSAPLYRLQSMDTIPVAGFRARVTWPSDLYAIPQYTFGADATGHQPHLSPEHTEYRWAGYATAYELLAYQSNQNALWELDERLRQNDLPPAI